MGKGNCINFLFTTQPLWGFKVNIIITEYEMFTKADDHDPMCSHTFTRSLIRVSKIFMLTVSSQITLCDTSPSLLLLCHNVWETWWPGG